VLPALDQPPFREPVENAHQGNRFDVEQFGEAGLMDAFVLREISDGLPLRTRQALMSGPLFESLAQEAGDLVQQKAKRWMLIRHSRARSSAGGRLT
jgi:hypothetical protein